MKYNRLGETDINVSAICLGSMTWGKQNSEAAGHAQLDFATAAGVNFIDTAEMYPSPPDAGTYGGTEKIIGTWLKQRHDRDKLIIASKICPAASWTTYIRNGNARLDRENINLAVDASLKRLQTDYIDLYQTHWPERDTNYFSKLDYYHAPEKDGVAIAETLDALGDLVKSGKIRYLGVSNETPWGVAEYLRQAERKSLPRIVSIQNPYNLLNRTFEIGLSEFSHREKTGLLAYSPLAFGLLSGKYLNGSRPAGARLTLYGKQYKRYSNDLGVQTAGRYIELAEKFGLDPVIMALAFVNSRPFLTSTIIGATNIEQLRQNIESVDVELSGELLREIDRIHMTQPNPCP